MTAVVELVGLTVAVIASGFMAWAIGAGSSGSTPFAPAVGARAISVLRAGLLVGIFGLLGAVLQGGSITTTIGRDLIGGAPLGVEGATIALTIAAVLVATGVFAGYPIATAFTVTGAVVGVGLGLGGTPQPAVYAVIGAVWLATPFVGAGAAFLIARLLRRSGRTEQRTVAALGGIVTMIIAHARFGPAGELTIIGFLQTVTPPPISPNAAVIGWTTLVGTAGVVLVRQTLRHDPDRGERWFLLILGVLVAFSAGASQVGLAIGPLVPVMTGGGGVPFSLLLVGGGVGLLIGSWTGAPRLIKALARDYSSLGPRRSIAAMIPAFAIAQLAVGIGVPVSFNEIIVSAIIGSGLSVDRAAVSRRKILRTALAWIGSLLLAVLIGYALAAGLSLL
jgi:PiT family inorganic phosphate transporter